MVTLQLKLGIKYGMVAINFYNSIDLSSDSVIRDGSYKQALTQYKLDILKFTMTEFILLVQYNII